MNEVHYEEGFICNELKNKYLDDITRDRLIEESQGDLAVDDSIGTKLHPPASVKRSQKEKAGYKVNLKTDPETPGGTIYYRMTELPTSSDGRVRYRSVKLSSKSFKSEKK